MKRCSFDLAVLLFMACATACAPAEDEDDLGGGAPGPATATAIDDGKADTTELRVRAGAMTLWVDRVVPLEVAGDQLVGVVRGRVSRTLTDARGWVPDDSFGETTITGARSFAVRLRGGHEVNSIVSGLPLFVAIDVTSGAFGHYDARVDVTPALFGLTGSRDVRVDASLAPVFVGGEDPLRYRATVHVPVAELTVGDAGAPTLTALAPDVTAVDFTYAELEDVARGGGTILFQDAAGRQRRARVGARVTAIGLTTEDARAVWPSTCERAVWDCFGGRPPGPDLTACGSYRQVERCAWADACEVLETAPFALAPLDLSGAFASGREAFTAGCVPGGTWCSLTELETFTSPECLAGDPGIAAVVAELGARLPAVDASRFADGQVLDRAGVAGSIFFSAGYSPGGPELWTAIDGFMASGTVAGWLLTEEVSCHNCTSFQDVLVLWYPDAFRALVLVGGHGYDS